MYDNFWQPYATPYQTRYNAPQQAFGSKLEVIRVNGKNGAEAFQMPPNSSIILLDESAPLIWLKMTDGAGYPTITPYRIEPLKSEPPVDMAVHRPGSSDTKNEQRAADFSRRKRIFDGG